MKIIEKDDTTTLVVLHYYHKKTHLLEPITIRLNHAFTQLQGLPLKLAAREYVEKNVEEFGGWDDLEYWMEAI